MKPKTGLTPAIRCNCDNQKIFDRTGHYCKHYEAELGPILGVDSRRIVFTDDIHTKAKAPSAEDLLVQKEEEDRQEFIGFTEASEEELRIRLKAFIKSERKVDALLARVVHCLPYSEIAEKLGYARPQGAVTAVANALETLRKKGFK